MMTKTHAWSGAALWLTTTATFHVDPLLAGAGTIIAWHAARLPDIDNHDSAPARQVDRLVPGLSTWLETCVGHRGLTHWGISALASGAMFAVLFAAITPQLVWFGVALGLGWLAHIAGDCLTWQGAPLFAPFTFRPIRPPYGYRFKTGGAFECVVVRSLMKIWAIAAAAMFVYISL